MAAGTSVSQLIGLVASSLPDGTKVLAIDNEFTSVTFPFAAQRHRGVTVTEVKPVELLSRLRGHDLVAVSAVQSVDGGRLDLDELRTAAEAAQVQVLIDVSQAAGWQPLRLDWAQFVVGAAYKWLLAPRGAAWMAVRRDALPDIVPQVANWSGAEDIWSGLYGLPLRLASDARRLDSSPVWFAQRGAAVSLSWLAGLDLTAVREHCVGLADATLAGLGLYPRGSAIISLDLTAQATRRLIRAGAQVSTRRRPYPIVISPLQHQRRCRPGAERTHVIGEQKHSRVWRSAGLLPSPITWEEYGGIEYGGLPVNVDLFAIMLYCNMFGH